MTTRSDRSSGPGDAPGAELPCAVVAVITRDDGRALIIRRAQGLAGGGRWCPVGGRPEPGETQVEALRREVLEEVGLDVEVGPEVHRSLTHDGSWRLVWYAARCRDPASAYQPLRLEATEVAAAAWLTPAEIAALPGAFPAVREWFGCCGDLSRPPGG